MSGLPDYDKERLLRIADILDAEAATWADGFSRCYPDGRIWDEHSEFAKVRFTKLRSAAAFLRKLGTPTMASFDPQI